MSGSCDSTDLIRIDRCDTLACRACKRWLEKACSDPECDYCPGRPPTAEGENFDDPNNTRPRKKMSQVCSEYP
jgi:hypothetical protein